ncbi:MAG TPA: hypothetical protein VI277_08800 [Candidatus Limnocylindria bacterium]
MTQTQSSDAPAAIGAPAAAQNEADLRPLGVVAAPEAGGWVVVNLDTLRVVEPGFVWPRREHAVRWAREELERERAEEDEYRRRQDEPTERGLARSWAGQQGHPDPTERR